MYWYRRVYLGSVANLLPGNQELQPLTGWTQISISFLTMVLFIIGKYKGLSVMVKPLNHWKYRIKWLHIKESFHTVLSLCYLLCWDGDMISKQLEDEDREVMLLLPLGWGFVEHLEVLSLLSWQVLFVIFRSGIALLLVVLTHFPLKICVQPCILDWNVSTASKSKPDCLLLES